MYRGINPLITLFLVQMLCVNNEKVVSSGKYGGAGILPGEEEEYPHLRTSDWIQLSHCLHIAFALEI
jgi:hypothetical protein